MSKYRVTINLDFDEFPNYKDVGDYLKDLIDIEDPCGLAYIVLNNATGDVTGAYVLTENKGE